MKGCLPLGGCQSSYTPESISASVQISLALPAGHPPPFTFHSGLPLKSIPSNMSPKIKNIYIKKSSLV